MSQIIHNISSPNDGLGDELRVAFDHQNEMNTELYTDKVDKETGKELSSNDFTDALKTKLLGIEDSAEVNIQSDWSQSDNTADDYIKNKPTLNNYVNTIGFFDYNNDDTTPLTLVANTEKKLENDCIGAYTNIEHPTHGVTRLFDPTTNNIVLDELGVGDLVKLRVDINVTTATANQVFKCILRLGIGTANEFEIIIHEEQIKSTGAHQRTIFTGFYVGSEEVRLALGELVLVSDHAGSVVVNGFFFEGIKRNVNFVELSGGSGTTPTLQEVTTEGNEVISSDNLYRVVFLVGGLEYYSRPTTGDAWVKMAEYIQSGLSFNLNDEFGTDIKAEFDAFVGLKIYNSTGDEIIITPTSATKNGVEFATIDNIPTLQEVTDALVNGDGHAETTTPIDILGVGSNKTFLQGDGVYNQGTNGYSYLSSEEIGVVGNDNNVVAQKKSGFKFQKIISGFVKRVYLKFDNIINDNVIFQLPNKSTGSYNLATEDIVPTTSTDLDALKRDGSNANADVDLSDYNIIAKKIKTFRPGTDGGMTLSSNNLTAEHLAEWQDKDYTGIADITDIPDVSGKEDTSNKSSSYTASSTTTYANTKALVDGLATKQATLSYTPYKFIQVSDTPHTGTTAETILATATIAGNTFPSTEVLEALFGVNKTGTGGAYTIRLKINTSNTLSGATTIATFTAGSSTAQWTLMSRSFTLLGGNLRGYPFTTLQVNDVMNVGGALSSTTYNTANTLYMFWCVTLVNSGDSITPNLCNLTNN